MGGRGGTDRVRVGEGVVRGEAGGGNLGGLIGVCRVLGDRRSEVVLALLRLSDGEESVKVLTE